MQLMNPTRRLPVLLVLAAVCLWMCGCGTYVMRGVVLEGPVSMIRVVDKDDPRLYQGYGLPMATVDATLDAERINRKPLDRGVSDVDGSFGVPVEETGAGYLDYYVRMVVRRPGYDTAISDIRIPGPDKRVLVTLAKGQDQYKEDPPDVLDETIEMSEPYMQ